MNTSPLLSTAIEQALNGWLKLLPDTSSKLDGLQDKVIAIKLRAPSLTLFFLPDNYGIQVYQEYAGTPDVRLTLSVVDLIKLGLSEDPAATILASDILIEGQIGIATAFSEILKQSQLDWEGIISSYIGDILAHQTAFVGNNLSSWLKEGWKSFQDNTSEYLTEESKTTPSPSEINHYLDKIDQLKHDVERISARVKRLKNAEETINDNT